MILLFFLRGTMLGLFATLGAPSFLRTTGTGLAFHGDFFSEATQRPDQAALMGNSGSFLTSITNPRRRLSPDSWNNTPKKTAIQCMNVANCSNGGKYNMAASRSRYPSVLPPEPNTSCSAPGRPRLKWLRLEPRLTVHKICAAMQGTFSDLNTQFSLYFGWDGEHFVQSNFVADYPQVRGKKTTLKPSSRSENPTMSFIPFAHTRLDVAII